jgi:hypothetical protein
LPTLGPPTTSTLISLSKDFLRRMPLIGDEFILVNYPHQQKNPESLWFGKEKFKQTWSLPDRRGSTDDWARSCRKKTRTRLREEGTQDRRRRRRRGVTRILKTGRRELNPKK